MLGFDKTVTLAHPNGSTYVCTVMTECSWFQKRVIASDANGVKVGHVFTVQIPADKVLSEPVTGDFVIFGAESVTTRAQIDGYTHFRVTAISDNRTTGILPHLAVSGT